MGVQRKRLDNPEERVQKAVVTYIKLAYPNSLYCASLGGIRTSFKQAVKAKATGYVKGFPDLAVYEPRGKYYGLFLEIKSDKKKYATKEQRQWIEDLNKRGYYACVAKGFDATKEIVDNYFAENL
tara:strand:+ start:3988 stop:4362 length:375 start_codon:yes stop_codon:yes gene_type:complete